jgi:hypothetical protein
LFKQIYYIFTQISSFRTWFVVGISRFQKWFDVDVYGFQNELCCRYFGIFWLGDCLSYFLKNWVIFFSNLLVPLLNESDILNEKRAWLRSPARENIERSFETYPGTVLQSSESNWPLNFV